MNVPLPASFNVAVKKPIDSRLVVSTYADLNNILNKYVGLQCYVEDEDSTYLYHGDVLWEKIVTNNIYSLNNNIESNFILDPIYNGKVIYVNNSNFIECSLPNSFIGWPNGFNTAIIQLNNGGVKFLDNAVVSFKNRKNFNFMTGAYSMTSIIRIPNTSNFLIFGDLINSPI